MGWTNSYEYAANDPLVYGDPYGLTASSGWSRIRKVVPILLPGISLLGKLGRAKTLRSRNCGR